MKINRIIEPGEWSVDNSKHRYGSVTGYQWTAVNYEGRVYTGISDSKEEAEVHVKIITSQKEGIGK